MLTVSERIKTVVEEQNLNIKQLAVKTETAQKSCYDYLSGRVQPKFAFLQNLKLLLPKLNLNYIFTGEKPIYLNGDFQENTIQDPDTAYGENMANNKDWVIENLQIQLQEKINYQKLLEDNLKQRDKIIETKDEMINLLQNQKTS